jgi:hypothetical protein
MADSGLFGASSIDPGTASGITEREPIILLQQDRKATDLTMPRFNFRGASLDDVSDALREALKMEYERYGTSIKRLEVTEKQARDRNMMRAQIGAGGFSRPLAHGGAGSGGGGSGRGR